LAFVAKKVTEAMRVSEGKALSLRPVGLLTKLVERSYRACEDDEDFDPPRPSSSSVEEQDVIEDEHEEE
jgi:hypothetical protein